MPTDGIGGVVPQNDLPQNASPQPGGGAAGGVVPSSDLPDTGGAAGAGLGTGAGTSAQEAHPHAFRLDNSTFKRGVLNEGVRVADEIGASVGHFAGEAAHFVLNNPANTAKLDEKSAKAVKGGAPVPLAYRLAGYTPSEAVAAMHSAAKWNRLLSEYMDPGNFLDWLRHKYTTAPQSAGGQLAEHAASTIGSMMLPIPGAAKGEVAAPELEADISKLGGDRGLWAQFANLKGYKIAPSEQLGNAVGKEVQATAGVPHVEMSISDHNVERSTREAAQDLELPSDTPLDKDTYHTVRQLAYQSYQDARSLGMFARNQKMVARASQLGSELLSAEAAHPEAFNTAEGRALIQKVNQVRNTFLLPEGETWTGDHAMTVINKFREDARACFEQGSNYAVALGTIYRDAAAMLEGRLADAADEATQTNKEFYGLGSRIRAARRIIAKSYQLEAATVGGRINPQALAAAYRHNVPLDGAALNIARLADMFPKSFRNPRTLTKMGTHAGAWFTRYVGMIGLLTHHPAMAMTLLFQNAAKHLAESDFFQPGKLTERAFNKGIEPLRESNLEGGEGRPSRLGNTKPAVRAGLGIESVRNENQDQQ